MKKCQFEVGSFLGILLHFIFFPLPNTDQYPIMNFIIKVKCVFYWKWLVQIWLILTTDLVWSTRRASSLPRLLHFNGPLVKQVQQKTAPFVAVFGINHLPLESIYYELIHKLPVTPYWSVLCVMKTMIPGKQMVPGKLDVHMFCIDGRWADKLFPLVKKYVIFSQN